VAIDLRGNNLLLLYIEKKPSSSEIKSTEAI
jgi:hypothetical protein